MRHETGFRDRHEAGHALAAALAGYGGRADLVVFGLARGGVPVAAEVAAALRAPLDVLVVRKVGVPGYEETAMGAVGPGVADSTGQRYRCGSMRGRPLRRRLAALVLGAFTTLVVIGCSGEDETGTGAVETEAAAAGDATLDGVRFEVRRDPG
jgi:hypothetical protein